MTIGEGQGSNYVKKKGPESISKRVPSRKEYFKIMTRQKKEKKVLDLDCEYSRQHKVVEALEAERNDWQSYVDMAEDYKRDNAPTWAQWANGHLHMRNCDIDIAERRKTLAEKEQALSDAQLVLGKIWERSQHAYRGYWHLKKGSSLDALAEKKAAKEKLREAVERVKDDHSAATDIIDLSAKLERLEHEVLDKLEELEADHVRLIGLSVHDRHEPDSSELEEWERQRIESTRVPVPAHGRSRTAVPFRVHPDARHA